MESSISELSQQQQQLKPENIPLLTEGISLILSRWTALQMAVQNEWGGRLSHRKAELLASDILSFFTQSKGPLYIDDLEELLFANTSESLNMVVEDGSIEEVAEKLMVMHEELLLGDLQSIEKLRKSSSASEAVSKSKEVVTNMNEGDDGSSADDASDMAVDEPKSMLDSKSEIMPMDEKNQQETVEAEDGWSVVSSRRNKSKRR
ncbi:hypothetical protein AQUCO_00600326v1 [Aquilegia coerulea]|uniref:Pre-rRNA-processing protein TSR2 homolog n=1 Tax=Aquilegia coerulea TaxID=218851 RepID=A0A2G5EP88_AQUCA|nr:hypothetical protein AQUCO_00600326v1 [Aquilegia coerulea]